MVARFASSSVAGFQPLADTRALVERYHQRAAQQLIGQDCSREGLSSLDGSLLLEGFMLAACQFERWAAVNRCETWISERIISRVAHRLAHNSIPQRR